jgi:O-acetyl-ADP-ribose deacetylase (regulator of RNase III)
MGELRALRLGGVEVALVAAQPIDVVSEALYAATNALGVLASGFGGAIRLAAGSDVERELMAQRPLLVGDAYLTGSGSLVRRGVARVAFGITTAAPGQSPRREAVVDALANALILLEGQGTRTLTVPEVASRIPGIATSDAAGMLIDELARRFRLGTRLERVTIASMHDDYLQQCYQRLVGHGARTA